ncbi:MAG: hypothetical protein HKN16_12095, partial [Saprospiraceae bacterium]|nr:hypothetical protein [Saprospiraceae bacterium]
VVPGDVVINELLFNPRTGSKDYIEVYNQSDKVLDISDWFFANRDTAGALSDVEALPQDIYLFPGQYLAFSEDVFDVDTQYPDPERPGRILLSDLPTMDDKEGDIVLYREAFPEAVILDEVYYHSDFHNPLLVDLNGVALERLSPTLSSNLDENWASAAGSAGFGTPAAPNSQQLFEGDSPDADFLNFGPGRLSPDGDGFEDFLPITYLEEPGDYSLSIRIFSSSGRLVKVLANNLSVGNEAFFKWDGDVLDGTRAPLGLYIVWAERFNSSGNVERLKKSIALAGLLD